MHNNFVTEAQANTHNFLYGGDFHATASSVFETNPQHIDLDVLSIELSEIVRTKYPFDVTIQPHRTDLVELVTYYKRPDVFVGSRCNDANRILMIDSDGEAIPAHGRCFRFPIANVRTHSLKRIWSHERLSHLRQTLHQAGGLLPACSRRCCAAVADLVERAATGRTDSLIAQRCHLFRRYIERAVLLYEP